MTDQTIRRVWIASRKELYVYTSVTEGPTEDIGMAYNLTITPMPQPPIVDGDVVEVVADLVELDKIRAALRLYKPSLLTGAFNALWRATSADLTFPKNPEGSEGRVYCVGHPKRPHGPF